MGHPSPTPVDVDPQTLHESQKLWAGFTKIIFWGVLHIIVILALMAYFLV